MAYNNFKHSNNKYNNRNQTRSRSGGSRIKKEYISTDKYIQAAKVTSTEQYIPTHQFSDFDIHPRIKTNLANNKFLAPTAIQDQAIPAGLKDQDIVGIANTGTGKTAAFAIPLLHKIITSSNHYALIMAPTRELAEQIDDNFRTIASGSNILGALLIGGTSIVPQLRTLRANPRVVIGTPGRIKDHFERGSLDLNKFNLVVLDEVDRMLDMGFINDISLILKNTASNKQFYFFTATLDNKVKTVVDTFTNNPIQISVKTGDTSANVEQNVVTYSSNEDKINKLHDLLIQSPVSKALVFDDTHRSVEKLCQDLKARGFEAGTIHGGKSQAQRQRALKSFKRNEIKILVATDVAARGIDVLDISHVINYSTPHSYGDYIHRIGRTGRAGKAGFALTFIER